MLQLKSRPEPADAFADDDSSEAAVIARAFRRTDRELDSSRWDAEVTVFIDAGVSDVRAQAMSDGRMEVMHSTASSTVKGDVMVSFEGGAAVSKSVTVNVGEETSVSVMLHNLSNISAWMPNG